MIQLCKSNNECQNGQYDDGDLAGAWGLHILLDCASVSLNRPRIQLSGSKSTDTCTHRVIEVGSETLVLLVIIFTGVAPFDGGRLPVPRAKTADPGWTSWRGHDIVVNPIELYTCPRVFGVGGSGFL